MTSPLIRVGFVGLSKTGWAANALGPALLSTNDKYTLTAVSTTSAESSAESAAKYSEQVGHPVKSFYGDTAQVSNDPEVDLVVVSVKAGSHKNAVLPAIEAGKDVFLEWPAGKNLNETVEIAEKAKAKGIRSIVGLQGRHTPVVQKVKELINSGKIGKVLSTTLVALAPRELGVWAPRVNERSLYTADENGGATLLDIAVGHLMDAFTYVLGPFSSVSATAAIVYPIATVVDGAGNPTGQTLQVTAPEHVAFTGILQSGVFASVTYRGGYASTPGRKQLLWEIDGEEGSIKIESDSPSGAMIHIRDPNLYLNGELISIESKGGFVGNLKAAWEDFAKGSEGSYATLEDAVKNRRLLKAIKDSAKEGEKISL